MRSLLNAMFGTKTNTPTATDSLDKLNRSIHLYHERIEEKTRQLVTVLNAVHVGDDTWTGGGGGTYSRHATMKYGKGNLYMMVKNPHQRRDVFQVTSGIKNLQDAIAYLSQFGIIAACSSTVYCGLSEGDKEFRHVYGDVVLQTSEGVTFYWLGYSEPPSAEFLAIHEHKLKELREIAKINAAYDALHYPAQQNYGGSGYFEHR